MVGVIIEDMAVRVSSPVLVGRAAESERLQWALQDARVGRSRAVLVSGEAGVGKTRLVTEVAGVASADGMIVLQGGCIQVGEGALPYAPVVEALRGYVRRADPAALDLIVGSARSELARLVPDLGTTDDVVGVDLSIGSSQGRLFELVLGVLERIAATAPVLLVIEDLHWSDRSTRDLLGFLVRNLRDASIALVMTYRSDELHRRHPLLPFLAELERSGRVERIELDPFDLREAAAQLQAIAGHDLDPVLIDSIHARSNGNAFFAEELLVAAGDDGRSELPPTLREVLLARLADLAEPTQEFLRVASAAGSRVDPGLLAAAAGLDEATLTDALRECVARQILVPDPTSGVDRYTFRHALLQEAVYDDVLPGERVRWHSAFARTLEARTGADAPHAAELAYHWYAAHDLPRALEASVAAGRAAEGRYAFPEASAEYERAIDLWDQVPDAEARAGLDRVELLATLANVTRYLDSARAVAHIQQAIGLVDPVTDPTRAGRLHERLGRYAWIAGQGDLSNAAYREAMRLTPEDPPTDARARAVAGLAQILMLAARFEESRALAEDALAIARAVGDRAIEGHALNTRGLDRAAAGEVDEGLADMDEALRIAEEVGNVDDIGRAYANWVWVLDTGDRLEEAIGVGEVGIEASERLGLMRIFGAHLLCNTGDYLYRLGRWDEAERAALHSESVGPLGINAILTDELLGRLAVARGRLAEATERLRPLAAVAARAVDVQFVAPVQVDLAELALWEGRSADAAARIDEAITLIDSSPEIRIGELYALGIRANADVAELERGRRSEDAVAAAEAAGDALLALMVARHADVLATRPTLRTVSDGWLALCEAEVERLHRRPDPDRWAHAAQTWDGLRRPYPTAYARWREAEARVAARGDRDRASATLQSALSVAESIGAAPLAEAINGLARRARLAVRPADGPDPATSEAAPSDPAADLGLTVREREVLELVAQGRTNRQIAEALYISENTAGVHVSNIIGKLAVTSRGEAAAMAYRLGLVEA